MDSRPGFVCPDCLRLGSLRFVNRLEVDGDALWDEIALQTLVCESCGFAGLAVYKEERRGSFYSETVEHLGYRIDRAGYDVIRGLIEACPNRDAFDCGCPTHATLGSTDPTTAMWNGLAAYSITGNFPMRLISRLWSPGSHLDGYEAMLNGKHWVLKRNSDPMRPVFTLSIDGQDVADLDSWPVIPSGS